MPKKRARATGVSRRKRIGEYIVKKRSFFPNFITMSNMTMGFFAIIYASKGDARSIATAGILVLIGSVFDAMDGAVARTLQVESPVGVQLDSLADGIAYGIAPAVIAYQSYLIQLPLIGHGFDFGMVIAPIYPICAVYRLARFNISSEEQEGFTGLPSPAAGIMISSIPTLSFSDMPFLGRYEFTLPLEVFICLYIVIGLLMVSRIDYNKFFSDMYKKGAKFIILIIFLAALFFFFRMWAVFVFTGMYIIAGLLNYAVKLLRRVPKGSGV